MRPKAVLDGLQEIRRAFSPILHNSAHGVLDEAQAGLYPFLGQRGQRLRGGAARKWGYKIPASAPLRFKHKVVDELGYVQWSKENAEPDEQDIKIRVWSNHHRFLHPFEVVAYDAVGRDIEKLEPEIGAVINSMTEGSDSGRVIYRCHFDKANAGQSGPKYHLQFGGAPQANECCWLPEVISLPRLVHSPYDLTLTCELVASNFYFEEYEEIQKNLTWRSVVNDSQRSLLENYYLQCLEAIQNPDREESSTLLKHLWNR
jgi:hypothetical protein